MAKNLAANIVRGRKCVYCGGYGLYRLADSRLKCRHCRCNYSLAKLRRDLDVLQYFCLELSAHKTARLLEMSYPIVRRRYMMFREKIAEHSHRHFKKLRGELEIDETYFGGKRKGKRGRGAFNKAIIFGILERCGQVHVVVVPDVTAETLLNEIADKTAKGSVYYTDCFKSYKSLTQYGKHRRINKQHAWAKGPNHINDIEGFWSYAKERFAKYHGINKDNYTLYLKEMEFRHNNRNEDLFKKMIHILYQQSGTKPY